MRRKSKFSEKVIGVVAKIRRGNTLTYQDVAKKAGNPRAARAVGNILSAYYAECKSENKKTIPCHRVIRSDGGLGGYAEGKKKKKELLRKEGTVLQ